MKTDTELQKDILEELLWDPLIPEASVGVAVADGCRYLNRASGDLR